MLRSVLALVSLILSLAAPVRAELSWSNPRQIYHRLPTDGHLATTFTFRNTGQTPVTIRKIKSSCGCTTAKLAKNDFAPGEEGEIAVKFNFGDRKGAQRKIITVQTDDRPEPMQLDLVVQIHEPLTVAPSLVFWRTGEPGSAKTVQLTAESGNPVRIRRVTSSNPRLATKLETIKAGERYAVVVTPTDTTLKEAAQITVETDFPADQPRSYTIHARIK